MKKKEQETRGEICEIISFRQMLRQISIPKVIFPSLQQALKSLLLLFFADLPIEFALFSKQLHFLFQRKKEGIANDDYVYVSSVQRALPFT